MTLSQRTVTLLGSTGSIGDSTVKLLQMHPERFQVQALTAHNNIEKLASQAKLLKASHVVTANPDKYKELSAALSGTSITVAAGAQALCEAANMQSDIVVAGIVGAAGLMPTLTAIRRGATIALANKESLVCAGDIFMREVSAHNATLIPVDSEHSAIFQVFNAKHPETIEKIILTASGGPFRTFTTDQMLHITPEQAVRHPKWSMGAKISVDSATMMNKGLELIEAYHLFGLPENRLDILVHPESIIHSLVAYIDGSVLAQMGMPDMCTPISYALAWPERIETPSARLDLAGHGSLTFEVADAVRFPALRLSREALINGGSACIVLNAANEVAVERFLRREIGFTDITNICQKLLSEMNLPALQQVEDVIELDKQTRAKAQEL